MNSWGPVKTEPKFQKKTAWSLITFLLVCYPLSSLSPPFPHPNTPCKPLDKQVFSVTHSLIHTATHHPRNKPSSYDAKMRTLRSTQPVAITQRMPALAVSSSFFFATPLAAPFGASPFTGTSLTTLGAQRMQLTKWP